MDPDGDVSAAGCGVLDDRGEGEEGLAAGALDAAGGEDEVVLWVGGLVVDELREVGGRGGDLGPGWRGCVEGLGLDRRELGCATDFIRGRV